MCERALTRTTLATLEQRNIIPHFVPNCGHIFLVCANSPSLHRLQKPVKKRQTFVSVHMKIEPSKENLPQVKQADVDVATCEGINEEREVHRFAGLPLDKLLD